MSNNEAENVIKSLLYCQGDIHTTYNNNYTQNTIKQCPEKVWNYLAFKTTVTTTFIDLSFDLLNLTKFFNFNWPEKFLVEKVTTY